MVLLVDVGGWPVHSSEQFKTTSPTSSRNKAFIKGGSSPCVFQSPWRDLNSSCVAQGSVARALCREGQFHKGRKSHWQTGEG